MYQHVVLAEAYGSLLWVPEVPCVLVRFYGFINLIQCQHLMEQALTLYAAHTQTAGLTGVVMDSRQLSALPVAAHLWLANTWNARAYATGLRSIRFVAPENIFGQIALQLYQAKASLAAPPVLAITLHTTLREALLAQGEHAAPH